MKLSIPLAIVSVCATACASAELLRNPQPFRRFDKRLVSTTQVDLGYEVYQGYTNSTSGLNIWKGIRFAAPPTGSNRWQAPQPPTSNRTSVISADAFAPFCPQSSFNGPIGTAGTLGNEDCLFLSVYAPSNATNLPVLVWIHGGGYGLGNGQEDLSTIINANGNSFVGVAIQYRLGAFGFLSSDEVFRNGVANAGILDQYFALQWVQSYIDLFGGNASQVTISGESAGGGAVMLQTMAYGGTLGTSLFQNSIAASPYLPMQYRYNDWVPSQSYYAFATAAGCAPKTAYGSTSQTLFQCLVSKNTTVLQNASFSVSASGTYGTWGFLPVTDGVFIQNTPSQQFLQKKVNGLNLMVGNNADEGPLFTPQNITTEALLVAWLLLTFPMFSNDDIAKILYYYPSSNASVNANAPDFATLGYTGLTALNQSDVGTGQQQRADNIYAETTFVCPSYWMAEAFSDHGRKSYKYQYSVPAATHGSDPEAYFGPASPNQGPDFVLAFRQMWGNFIRTSNPSISSAVALGASASNATSTTTSNSTSTNSTSGSSTANPATSWPPFTVYAPYQLNLNETGGIPTNVSGNLTPHNVTEYLGSGLRNNFTLVNAYAWEGGRGVRCDFWRAVAGLVPE